MNKEKRIIQLRKYSNSVLIRLIIQLEETLEILEKEKEGEEKNEQRKKS